MNILFCQWNSICEFDVKEGFKSLGYSITDFRHKFENVNYDIEYLKDLSDIIFNNNFDFVFTINFFPIISRVCDVMKVPYVSWTVDSPLLQLYSVTIKNKWNRIFIFDETLYNRFVQENPECIFYLPLGTNVEHSDQWNITNEDLIKFSSDISFVGSLYTEKCKYNELKDVPPYIRGYVDGVIESQLQVYGYNFIEDALTDEVAQALKKCADWGTFNEEYKEDTKALLAHEYIGDKCTEIERIRILNMLAGKYTVDFYTQSDTSMLEKVNIKGEANSRTEMPKIFKLSKINLNITAKTICTGLSLRIFDIMGAGGFLLSNYQAEIPYYFEIGKDLVVYESQADLKVKVEYYLNHEDERKAIAVHGYETVKKFHTYVTRLKQMIAVI